MSCRLQVAELRRHGVTLTLSLERPREPIPDVPAVYFLSATEANVAAVVSCTARCMQRLSCGVHITQVLRRPGSAEEQQWRSWCLCMQSPANGAACPSGL